VAAFFQWADGAQSEFGGHPDEARITSRAFVSGWRWITGLMRSANTPASDVVFEHRESPLASWPRWQRRWRRWSSAAQREFGDWAAVVAGVRAVRTGGARTYETILPEQFGASF
jgi:hypothetical protein